MQPSQERYVNGLLKEKKPGDGDTITYSYDSGGRLIREEHSGRQLISILEYYPQTTTVRSVQSSTGASSFSKETYTHAVAADKPARITQAITSRGEERRMLFDPLGRLVLQWGNGNEPLSHQYDSTSGLLTASKTWAKEESFAGVTVPTPSASEAATVSYEYDTATKLLLKIVRPDSSLEQYSYDKLSRQTRLSLSTQSGATRARVWEYHPQHGR
jgi:YD repeat-containing protein